MAKMYYNEAEAAEKLGITPDELLGMIREGKVRAFADGAKKMFKTVDIDAMAPAEADLELIPAEEEVVSLADAEMDTSPSGAGTSSGDTVITSEGISIFDDDDLEIEMADPMAKTQIAPSVSEPLTLSDGTGGSGLLDLTRESDDTSLGAEVLDHIDMDAGDTGAGPSSDDLVESVAESVTLEPEATPQALIDEPLQMPTAADPTAAAMGGLAIGGTLMMMLLAAIALGMLTGQTPGFLTSLGDNLTIVVGGGAATAVVAALIGFVLGKSASTR